MTVKIALLGFGTVASGVPFLLKENGEKIVQSAHSEIEVAKVLVKDEDEKNRLLAAGNDFNFVTKSKIDQNLDFEDLADLPDMEELAQMSPDEFLKTLEKSIAEKTKDDIEAIQSLEQVEAKEEQEQADKENESKKEPYIYYILRFASLVDLVAFAKTVNYQMETSELYKMNGHYYLTILVDVENHPSPYPAWLLARMREFADDSDISRSVLQEYGQILINHDAVLNLQKIRS